LSRQAKPTAFLLGVTTTVGVLLFSPVAKGSKPGTDQPAGLGAVLKEAAREPAAPPDLRQQISRRGGKYAEATAQFVINRPPQQVWQALTDYSKYPQIFHRIQSCRITRRQGDLIWIESELKPHLFVRHPVNRTLNDLRGKPQRLDWQLLEGNFKEVRGWWQLAATGDGNRCQVDYVIEVDPGPVIPKFLVSFALRFVQKEVIAELKSFVESHGQQTASAGEQAL
jgi:ribosome-associated toxin RatA of RatAB toxin-antitoxin module